MGRYSQGKLSKENYANLVLKTEYEIVIDKSEGKEIPGMKRDGKARNFK